MKKAFTLATLTVFFALVGISNSQAQAYEKGRNYLNAGLGLGGTYGGGGFGIGASFEHGFTDAISAGGLVGFTSGNLGYLTNDYRFTVISLAARGSYHLTELLNINNDKLDLYAGLGLGYRIYNDNVGNVFGYRSSYNSGLLFLGHVGGRYFFTPNVGGYAELGAGFAVLQAGVTFKF